MDDFKNKFKNDSNFKELQYLKEVHSDVIMGGCKLSKNMLDAKGNRSSGWPDGEMRGNKPYYSPKGWIGIGLKVEDRFDGGDNTWLGMFNIPGEWCVAYHGVGRGQDSDNVKSITKKIYEGGFKPGNVQAHQYCNNINKPGTKVDVGVYCTPKVDVACSYSGQSIINGKRYHTVIMVRVKRSIIRQCNDAEDYWVVNGTTDEIRPYRILYKEV